MAEIHELINKLTPYSLAGSDNNDAYFRYLLLKVLWDISRNLSDIHMTLDAVDTYLIRMFEQFDEESNE